MNKPKISIIITSYNYDKYIGESIKSALSQDYSNIEVIVVDDASTDKSREIIKDIAQNNYNVKPIFLDNNVGVSKARNIGVKESMGYYITFLDADDYYGSKNMISLSIDLLKKNNDKCAVYSKTAFLQNEYINYNDKTTIYNKIKYKLSNCKEGLISNFIVGTYVCAGLCYKKSLFYDVGGFDIYMDLHEDTDYLIRLSSLVPFKCTYSMGVVHRVKKAGLSDKDKNIYDNVLRKIRQKYYSRLSLISKMIIHILDFLAFLQLQKNKKRNK